MVQDLRRSLQGSLYLYPTMDETLDIKGVGFLPSKTSSYFQVLSIKLGEEVEVVLNETMEEEFLYTESF